MPYEQDSVAPLNTHKTGTYPPYSVVTCSRFPSRSVRCDGVWLFDLQGTELRFPGNWVIGFGPRGTGDPYFMMVREYSADWIGDVIIDVQSIMHG